MKLPIGIQDFEDLRTRGDVYVDKTEYIYRLMEGSKYQFFARPRRFGKSLTLTTLKAAYEGKKELFKGLWLENNYHFEPYPVIHIDFTRLSTNETSLNILLLDFFIAESERHNIAINTTNAASAFQALVIGLHRKHQKQVVMLIDEYDKPLVDFLDKPETLEANQKTLQGLYGTIKGLGMYTHMVFLTGVSKFGKLNLFSSMNNVKDISLDKKFALMCGYSKEELDQYFPEYHKAAQQELKLSPEQYWEKLQFWYNGYSWNGITTLYCPYSTLLFLSSPKFKDYWYETGTPTLLIKMIEQWQYTPFQLENFKLTDEDILTTADVDSMIPEGLMFQTGYLTIKRIYNDRGFETYELGYPNEEVRQAFSKNLLQNYIANLKVSAHLGGKLQSALLDKEWDQLFKHVNTALAAIPYDVFEKKESYFNSLMHLMLIASGLYTLGQVHTNIGRIDNVVEHLNSVYIFEYKVDGSAQAALQQIKDKYYAQKFSGKDITLIGVNFSSELKQATEWLVERIVP